MNKARVIVYTKDACPYCVYAKDLLRSKNVEFYEMRLGSDLTREEFIEIFPTVRTVPFIIIDGEHIGGYDKLTEWLERDAGRSFLAEFVS